MISTAPITGQPTVTWTNRDRGDMAFRDFSFPQVEQELGLRLRDADLFSTAPPVPVREVVAEMVRDGTELAQATAGTIRVKLFKVAAAVRVSVRRVYVQFCSAYPMQEIFALCLKRLKAVARPSG